MSQAAHKLTLYDHLLQLPEGVTGEIMNGQLYTHPRPARSHVRVESALGADLFNSFDRGRNGPGGWWIVIEPEIHFVRDTEVVVPDLAGWRRSRIPTNEDHRFEVVPDWVCEILSPSTASQDREIKMPLYAHYGVEFLWLIEPKLKWLEAYRLDGNAWTLINRFEGAGTVAVTPFEAVELRLEDWWC